MALGHRLEMRMTKLPQHLKEKCDELLSLLGWARPSFEEGFNAGVKARDEDYKTLVIAIRAAIKQNPDIAITPETELAMALTAWEKKNE